MSLRKLSNIIKNAIDRIYESYDDLLEDKSEIYDDFKEFLGEEFIPDATEFDKLNLSIIGKKWEIYSNSIVKNIKGRGIPVYSEVIEYIAKKRNIPTDQIEEKLSEERFYNIFWDQVNFSRENDENLNDSKVYGRSGGYWGFDIGQEMISYKQNEVERLVDKILNGLRLKYRNVKEISLYDVMDNVREIFEENRNSFNFTFEISDKWLKIFKETDNAIEALIKDFESVKTWNEYFEDWKF